MGGPVLRHRHSAPGGVGRRVDGAATQGGQGRPERRDVDLDVPQFVDGRHGRGLVQLLLGLRPPSGVHQRLGRRGPQDPGGAHGAVRGEHGAGALVVLPRRAPTRPRTRRARPSRARGACVPPVRRSHGRSATGSSAAAAVRLPWSGPHRPGSRPARRRPRWPSSVRCRSCHPHRCRSDRRGLQGDVWPRAGPTGRRRRGAWTSTPARAARPRSATERNGRRRAGPVERESAPRGRTALRGAVCRSGDGLGAGRGGDRVSDRSERSGRRAGSGRRPARDR